MAAALLPACFGAAALALAVTCFTSKSAESVMICLKVCAVSGNWFIHCWRLRWLVFMATATSSNIGIDRRARVHGWATETGGDYRDG